jgi:hypothetical protein
LIVLADVLTEKIGRALYYALHRLRALEAAIPVMNIAAIDSRLEKSNEVRPLMPGLEGQLPPINDTKTMLNPPTSVLVVETQVPSATLAPSIPRAQMTPFEIGWRHLSSPAAILWTF